MTNYRMRFVPAQQPFTEYYDIPLGCIAKFELKSFTLLLNTKDFRNFQFSLLVDSEEKLSHLYTLAMKIIYPETMANLFAFGHRLPLLPCSDGWNQYEPMKEWTRIGIKNDPKWRITSINRTYDKIESYPSEFIVPATISDETIVLAIPFRAAGRIPVVTWMHQTNGAIIARSSQPKIGMSNACSEYDQELIEAIAMTNYKRQILHIIDCRPKSSAHANRAKGYGTENTSTNYNKCTIEFMNVPNIHAIRESFRKVGKLAHMTDVLNWYTLVEDTKWLYYIRLLLKAGMHVAQLIDTKAESVLIHCSHGWDRTCQITSIAQLLLDPYFRTIDGFQTLLEKEWVSFGHPFQLRLAHGEKKDTQQAPIIIQFFDCVYQLVSQYPTHFEFNSSMLVFLTSHVYSCRFGNFFMDQQKEREKTSLTSKCTSIWTLIDHHRNVFYQEAYFSQGPLIITPIESVVRNVSLWTDVYMRWTNISSSPVVIEEQEDSNLNWQLPLHVRQLIQREKCGVGAVKINELKKEVELLKARIKEWDETFAADVSVSE